MPRLWLLLLIVIALAFVAARTMGRTNRPEPSRTVQPTRPAFTGTPPTSHGVEPAAAPGATAPPTAIAHAAPAPARTPRATSPQTPTATGLPHATAPTQVASSSATTAVALQTGTNGVALTFDAGADRGYAEDILDQLREERVLASFGITGAWARANPDLVRRMAADGHLVFNHTLDHRSFTGASDSLGGLLATARRAELDDADTIIAPLIGHSTRPFYRLPYGDDDAKVATDVASTGYTRKIGWTVDSLGWRGNQSADIVARCVRLAAPGAVYVFHVGRASQDALALPRVIHALRERGFAFRRVDQS